MSDVLGTAAAWLHGQLRSHASRVVTYRRGSQSVELPAVVGQTTTERDDGSGMVLRSKTRDYLIAVADLAIEGQSTQPQRGDRIEESDGHVYQVLPLGSDPEWRYSSPINTVYRVHTRLVEEPA